MAGQWRIFAYIQVRHRIGVRTVSTATQGSFTEAEEDEDWDFSWIKYLRNPSQWGDGRDGKTNQRSLEFNNWHDPPWLQELRREALHSMMRPTEPKHRELCVEKGNMMPLSRRIDQKAQQGKKDEEDVLSISNFNVLQKEEFPGDNALVASLKACAKQKDLHTGSKIHADILKKSLHKRNYYIGSALVSMYAKCGALAKAQEVFDELPIRDVVTWTALIAGYAQHGHGEEALSCFERMQCEGPSPNAVTFACVIKACGSIGAAEKGNKIHAMIAREDLLKNVVLGSALVDMYAKCGALPKAQEVFVKLHTRNVITWTALIAGYTQHGYAEEALNFFEQMLREGLSPNAVTFLVVLNACCYAGLLKAGETYFASMSTVYGIVPTVEHRTCMVDLFGRAGHFDKAIAVIEKMPFSDRSVWSSLLGACQKWGNVKLGRLAFERAVQLDEKYAAAYVCMSHIYSAAGMQQDADQIEAMRVKNKAWKKPGCCWWTDVIGNVHSFHVGDKSHLQNKRIYAKLEEMVHKISLEGYFPSPHWMSQDIYDDTNQSCAMQE